MKTRNISLDIYRIICMFLITTIHIIGYSNIESIISRNNLNFYLIKFIDVLQVFSISGFMLVSAYFLINKPNTIEKIVSFVFQVVFCSVIIFLLSLLFAPKISLLYFIKSIFPILSNHYWYPINYLFILALSPFLNKCIFALNKKENIILIIILTIANSLFFHLNPFADPYQFLGHHTHSLLWFILLYLIAAYIKQYGIVHKRIFGIGMFLVCGLLLFVLFIIRDSVIVEKLNLLSYNSILSLLFTVSSFILFVNLKISTNNAINRAFSIVVPSVFFVYLIQEHIMVRNVLWKYVDIIRWGENYLLIPIMVGVFLALFFVAFVLHRIYLVLRKLFINKLEKCVLHIIDNLVQKFVENRILD